MKLIIFLKNIIFKIFGRNMQQKYSAQIFHIHEIMEKCHIYGIFVLNIFGEFFIFIKMLSISYPIILYYLIWNAILKVSPRKSPARQNEGMFIVLYVTFKINWTFSLLNR